MQYCSLQHWTLSPLPLTSTTGYCSCFGSVPSFFLELFLHCSPGSYWHLLTWGVHLSVSYIFAFSYCSWDSQGKHDEMVCHSLLQWIRFCQNSPPWPIHHGWPIQGMAHSFIELDKAVVHVVSLISFLWLWFSFCLTSRDKDKGLMEASWWERVTEGETGSCSDGWGHAL